MNMNMNMCVCVGKSTTNQVNDWYQTALMNNHSMNLYVRTHRARARVIWRQGLSGVQEFRSVGKIGCVLHLPLLSYKFFRSHALPKLQCCCCCCRRRRRRRLLHSSSIQTSNDFWFHMNVDCTRTATSTNSNTSSNSGKAGMCVSHSVLVWANAEHKNTIQ